MSPSIPSVPIPGRKSKMIIRSYADAKMDDTTKKEMEVLINPESYTQDYKLKVTFDAKALPEAQLKYVHTEPSEMTFEFLFDCTGIIDGNQQKDISGDIAKLKLHILDFNGEEHQPPYVVLAWGTKDGLFKGRLIALSINYKLFSPDGAPLRAVAKATFKASLEEEEAAAKTKSSSPDLTHSRIVKAGDTLPLMCNAIYGDPKHYIEVAKFNKLTEFKKLQPGTIIVFPPLQKTSNTG